MSGTNGALGAGEKIQVSNDGGATWHDVVQNTGTTWSYVDPTTHGTSFTYSAQIVDLAANVGTTASQAITIDSTGPVEALAITAIANDTGTAGDFITSDTTLTVSGTNGALGAGEKIQVSNDGGATWHDVVQNTGTTWSYVDPTTHGTSFTYSAQIVDLAANVGTTASQAITIDSTGPVEALAITAIANDTGTAGDFITSDTTLTVSGTNGALGAGEKIQVSNDGGATWHDVVQNTATTWSYVDPTTHGTSFTYSAQIVDLAANVGTTANWFDVTQSTGTSWTYNDIANPHLSDVTYQVRVIDAANNVSDTASRLVIIDTTADVGGNLAVSVSDSLISNSEKTAVAYTVSGLDADATATVTFTDHNGAHVAGVAGVANLSTLADGPITVSISATDTAGNTANGTGTSTTLDTTADVGGNLAVSVSDSLISNSEKTAVAYTVSGLDADATATVTFTDHNGAHVAGVAGVANLSTLADGPITVSISATDTAGNTANGTGTSTTLDTTADVGGNLAVSVSDSLISNSEKTAVAYTVSGLDADATATVTFTDHNGAHVAGVAGVANLSTLADGPITVSISATDTAGNTANGTGTSTTLDTTADVGGNLAVSVSDSLISNSEKTAVAYTVSGLDADATATVTFTDHNGAHVAGVAGVANLSTLADGPITVSISATDTAGNTANGTGTSTTLDTTADVGGNLAVSVSDSLISNSEKTAVAYTVSGLDADATATVTFTDHNGAHVAGVAGVANLSTLADGPITVSISATDTAGNAANGTGTSTTLDTTADVGGNLAVSVSDSLISNSEKTAVAYTVSGLDADATATVTFTDHNGAHVAGVAGVANLSTLADGPITVSISATDTAGNTANGTGTSTTLDTTADVGGNLAVSVSDSLISNSEKTAVAYTVSGLDADATATVTFTDHNGAHVAGVAGVANLSTLADGPITVSISATDTAGNTANGTGTSTTLDTTADVGGNLAVSVSDSLISNSEKTAVAYTVSGLDADATATVTFTDHNGAHVAGVAGVANLSTLADGPITVSISATDTAGNTANGTGTSTTLDTTADVGGNLAVSVSDSLISNSEKTAVAYTVSGLDADATATVTFTDHNGAHVAGVAGVANLSTLADGPITVSISATDTAGNTANGTGTSTTLDTTADVGGNLAVSVSDSLISNSEKTAVAYTVSGLDADATATVTFTDHNGAHVAGVAGVANLSTLADGPITVSISATDTAGNTANGTGTSTTLDTTADVGGNLAVSVSDSLISNSEKTAVAYTVSGLDADATATVTFTDHNGAHVAGVAGVANLSTLADGPITVSISATDTAGNTANGTGTSTTLDTTPPNAPVITTTAPAQDTAASIDISGAAEANSAITLYNNGTAVIGGTATADGTGHWSVSGVALTNGADYSFTAKATDAAGNISGASNALAFHDNQTAVVITTIVTPNGYDMHGLYGDMAGSDGSALGATHDDTHFDAINTGTGHTFHLIGTGFTYDVNGFTGGTVNEIDIFNTANGTTLVTMVGFAIDAVALNAAVNALQTSDFSQLNALFDQYSYDATGGSGNDTLLAFGNADAFDGGGGLNTVDYVHYGSGITADLANPSLNTGNAAGDGYSNINSLIGTNYNDTLIGDANNNALEGGAGADTLIGGGGALDFASYVHAPTPGVTAYLVDPSDPTYNPLYANTGDAAGDIYIGINGLIGSNFADKLIGDNNDNYLRGRGGGDVLDGGGGSDTADYAHGGAVRADLSNPATNFGDATGDTYISIENLRGSDFNDVLVGDAGNNRLEGGLGIDQTIYTAATGGIIVDMAAGTVSGPGVGNDTLVSIESIRGSAFADTYVATGYTGASAIGSVPATYNEFEGMAGDDVITGNGNTALSYLHATDGVTVDLLAGTAHGTVPGDLANIGTDTFTGVQVVRGSAYNDTLLGSNNTTQPELFEGDGGNDFIDGRGGFDRVTYAPRLDNSVTGGITVSLAAGTVVGDLSVGTDTLRSIEAVRGTNFADTYNATGFGQAGAVNIGSLGTFNEFEGMGGDDNITGNGNTRISYINATAGVTVDLAFTTVSGSTGIAHATAIDAGIGTDTIFGGVNAIIGSGFADTLYGSNNASLTLETFDGGAGNDTIDGRGGFDQAVYNADNGTASGISVDMAAGTVAGDASIGTDTLISIESVRGTNFADTYVATGFSGASTDTGLAATFNEFEGMAGNDTITGNGNTRISYVSATGGVSVDLAAGTAIGDASVGTDTFTGVSRVRGSNFNDTISGDANNNVLEGQGGNDVLFGRGGNDTLTGGTGSDRFFYSSGADTITDFDRSGGSFNHTEGDTINLAGSGVTTWAQLQLIMSQDVANPANTLINFGGGNTMTLNNVTVASLTPSDFMFGVPISGDLGISVNKSGTVVLTTTDFHAVDPNYTAGQLTFTVSNPTNGHVSFAANPGIAITSFTEADLEAGHVLFVHDGSNTTAGYLQGLGL